MRSSIIPLSRALCPEEDLLPLLWEKKVVVVLPKLSRAEARAGATLVMGKEGSYTVKNCAGAETPVCGCNSFLNGEQTLGSQDHKW